MKKSRTLILALALSAGVAGATAGPSVLVSAPPAASAQAAPRTLEVATDPAAVAFDVVGSGIWRRAWKLLKCAGRAVVRGYPSDPAMAVEFVVCYAS